MIWVLAAVALTAVVHASWNALAKSVPDRWVATGLMAVVLAVFGGAVLLITGLPTPASWPFALGSGALQGVYLIVLTRAYSVGELSRIYPVARGLAPIVVTLVSVTVLGERLSAVSWIGLIVLMVGIAWLVLGRGLPRPGMGLGLALLTGLLIASYSLTDGVGVQRSSGVFAYIGLMMFAHGVITVTVVWWRGGSDLVHRARPSLRPGLLGGALSVLAYGVVVWAQRHAPLALVSGLRETSVVWALLIGRVVMAERLGRRELTAVVVALVGAVVLQAGAA